MSEKIFHVSMWTEFGIEPPKIFLDQHGSTCDVYRLDGISNGNVRYVSTGVTITKRGEVMSLVT